MLQSVSVSVSRKLSANEELNKNIINKKLINWFILGALFCVITVIMLSSIFQSSSNRSQQLKIIRRSLEVDKDLIKKRE